MKNRKTLTEAKIIARSSDPVWLGEELFRLQEQAIDRDVLMEQNARYRMALETIAAIDEPYFVENQHFVENQLARVKEIARDALVLPSTDVPPAT